ncbi:hypothetical protein PIB30_118449 [Stylosanthes scabra]|uniref:Rab-GAP TBC domain-containing protein n=1 Tax=Stylosanthes scabra TaxID=79078 RepID=A0ABU6T9U4_9FABA|nr:hypothetical protein [Stylosanthes scabra]
MENSNDDDSKQENKDSAATVDSRFNQTLRNVQGLLKGRSIPGKILLSQRVDLPDNPNLYSPPYERSSPLSDIGTSDHTSETLEEEVRSTSKPIDSPNENVLKLATLRVENLSEEVRKSSMSSARATDSARVMKFNKVLSGTMVILDKLRELAWSGVPDYMRPTVWRLLLIEGKGF